MGSAGGIGEEFTTEATQSSANQGRGLPQGPIGFSKHTSQGCCSHEFELNPKLHTLPCETVQK